MEIQNQPEKSFSQIPELHKRHFRSFWPIVLIAAVSALVGGILVFLLFNQGLDEQLNSLLPGSNYRQTHEQVKDTENNIATWQTYRNEEYGFEIKLPANWDYYPFTKESDLDFGVTYKGSENKNVGWIAFTIYPQLSTQYHKELDEWYKTQEGYFPESLGELDGQAFIVGRTQDVPPEMRDEYKKINQILSTFKFTDQQAQTDTSNWQTYTNEEYGFELDYPGEWNVIKVYDEVFLVQPNKENCISSSTIVMDCVRLEINFNVQSFVDYEPTGSSFQVISPEKLKVVTLNKNSFWVLEDESEGLAFRQLIIKDKFNRYHSFTVRRNDSITEQQVFDQILSTFKFLN